MSNKNNTNGVLIGVIIVLLLVIVGGGAYFLGQKSTPVAPSANNNEADVTSPVEVTVISDKRCSAANCDTTQLVAQLKQISSLSTTDIKVVDYNDEGVKEIFAETGLKKLPAVLFSHNFIPELKQFLKATQNNQYSLELGEVANFDPTLERSEKGFVMLDKNLLAEIKKDAYVKGNSGAKITWIEYSDLQCPYCAKLHNSGTPEDLIEKYGDQLNQAFQNFPLDFHKNAMPAAEAIECLAQQKGPDAYYELIHTAFSEKKSDLDFLVEEAVKLGADKTTFEACVEAKTFEAKIKKQQQIGSETFGITGTPGNVLINNETGEYEVISGAYPTSTFVDVIERMLK